MENAQAEALYAEWQRAVIAHAGMVRDGRMRGLTIEEIGEIGCAYLLRIDMAYARYKQAEAMQEAVTSA